MLFFAGRNGRKGCVSTVPIMPITRSAFQRYRLIDEIISRYPRQYSKQKLFELCQETCGIRSISSLEKDIQRLREDHDAPIAYCKRRNGYYYMPKVYI